MTIRIERISSIENMYGVRYHGENGRMAEAVRCYAGQWHTFCYINGHMQTGEKPDVSPQRAKSDALKFVKGN